MTAWARQALDALERQQPGFKLAQLLRADLLAARNGGLNRFGGAQADDQRPAWQVRRREHQRQHALEPLHAQAKRRIVALNRLIEKREPDEQHQPRQEQQGFTRYAGFHRNTGFRAAITSSGRQIGVLCGAS